ncbi:hypothetical protein M8J77_023592 [Diaphorina citri]|nr:hypothetical protein M8J77_023592 [Diaphorina citri]
MPRGERFYHRHKDLVVDGTRCDVEGMDVCVEGKCLPVGCDMLLGSPKREDRCRVCGGDGSTCQTLRGVLDNNDMQVGYNDLLLIPAGATSVKVRERTPSNNYLAIRNMSGHYYLNGNWRIDYPKPLWFAGTVFYYERNTFYAPESISALGPTTEPLYVVLLYTDRNTGVEYEYSIPNGTVQETGTHGYAWQYDEFSPCSVNCGGGGYKSRRVWCKSSRDQSPVSSDLCDPALEPVSNQHCGNTPCPPQWRTTEWSACSANCGDNGTQSREVDCIQINENGITVSLPDSRCPEGKPNTTQECNRGAACPKWHIAPWKPCDHLCGDGKQKRSVKCYREDKDGHREVVPDSACNEEKPESEKPCNLRPCEGVDWLTSEWTGCEEKCGSSLETRTAVCATKNGKIYPESFCLKAKTPELQRECESPPPCEHQWYATQWSKCSAKCGTGIQTRKVFCGALDGESIKKVDDSKCDPELKYNATKNCTSSQVCKGHWMSGPWSKCSKTCGGGTMERKVLCFLGNKTVAATECDPEKILFASEDCNSKPCGDDEVIPVEPTGKVAEADEEEECEEEEEEGEETVNNDTDEVSTKNPKMADLLARIEGSTTPAEEEGSGDYESSPISSDSTPTDSSVTGSTPTDSTVTESTGSTTEATTETGTTDVPSSTDTTPESTTGSTVTDGTSTVTPSTEQMMSDGTQSSLSTSDETSTITPGSSTIDSSTPDSTTDASTLTPPTTDTPTTITETTPTETTITGIPSVITTETTTDASTTEISTTEAATSTTEAVSSTTVGSTTETSTVASSTAESTLISSTAASSTTLITTESTMESTTGETSTVLSTTEGSTSTPLEKTTVTDLTSEGFSELPSSTGSTTEVSTITTSYDTSSLSTIDSTTTLNPLQTAIVKEVTLKKCKTKKPKKPKCDTTEFGCCFDGITAAKGPFSAGCPEVMTCNETEFKCCPDGVSPAVGPEFKGCPPSLCKEELFGCCPDGVTTAENENGTGCPEITTEKPSCKTSEFGCCPDNILPARGPNFVGCALDLKTNATASTTPTPDKSKPSEPPKEDCAATQFGCCPDGTAATKKTLEDCAGIDLKNCSVSAWGCCPDSNKTALSPDFSKGCKPECAESPHGCCDDNVTAAHGPYKEGCCLNTPYGCCPDNILPARGPNLEGCGCVYTPYGCCPDNQTVARGPDNAGCGCQYTEHKCCPDKYTPATGPNYEGCPCYTYQFGCCPDGVTRAVGPRQQGCGCQNTPHGCCGDGQTPAPNPAEANCTCDVSKFGCCPDGVTDAQGKDFEGCENIPKRPSEACSLPKDNGPCRDFTVKWFYDGVDYGGCNRFWYGGCEGNGNRFKSQEECRAVCVEPSGKDVCLLPKSAGPCINTPGRPTEVKWYYDKDRKQCGQFHYGGCPGNNNRFDSRQECEALCGEKDTGNPCEQPIERGDCNGNYPRWAFNKEAKSCEQFYYGGCKGNGNNFQSESACLEKCLHPGRTRDECLLPRAPGSCSNKISRWYFDQSQNRCMPFYFTGCDGNGNNFESRQACETSCPPRVAKDICLQPAVIGDCANYVLTWYYDSLEARCRQFYYGGCGGNQNNFMTEEACQARCAGGTFVTSSAAPDQLENRIAVVDVCDQPKDVGPCNGNYEQWYYDRDTDSCQPFQYGGCQGNHNRFNDQWSCQKRCVQNIPPPDPAQTPSTTLAPRQEAARNDLCFLESESGPCTQQEAAWYFDRNTYRCQSFIYGGCEGNANRFNTEEQCERLCGEFRAEDACRVPVDPGPCRGNFSKFYFDPDTSSCQEFRYGGCPGSANRFSTIEECESFCFKQEEILPVGSNSTEARSVICRLPGDGGMCSEYHKRYYYDERRQTCVPFIYTGCGGNLNRFTTSEECLHYCSPPRENEIEHSSPEPPKPEEDPCAAARAECSAVFNCNYGVERWINQLNCERCRCFNPCQNQDPQCPSNTRCAVDLVRNPETRETQYIAVCRPLYKEGECRPQPQNVCADNCKDDADCTGQAKCCPNDCGYSCSNLFDITTTTTTVSPAYPVYTSTPYTPNIPSPPRFHNYSEPTVEAEEGNFVTLRCIAIGYPIPVYTWSKGEVSIDGSDGHYKLTLDGVLQIVGLVRQDAGIYVCVAANGIGDPIRKEFNVIVRDPVGQRPAAVIGEDPTSVIVRLGYPTIVPCYAIGYPQPIITWWRQNEMIQVRSENYELNKNMLTIKRVEPERLGAYTCQAYNGLGRAVSWTVTLQALPSEKVADPNAIDYGTILSSAFPSESASPVVTQTTTTTTEATSPHVYAVPVKVNITLETQVFGVGSDISIPCDVDGYPIPQVFWYKDGQVIENDGVHYRITESNRLHINQANATDSGEYRCVASNSYTSDENAVTIRVEGIFIHPSCRDLPLFANCKLIVEGRYCQHHYYSQFCCESCTRAGQLPSYGPHIKRAVEAEAAAADKKRRSRRSLVSRLFDL